MSAAGPFLDVGLNFYPAAAGWPDSPTRNENPKYSSPRHSFGLTDNINSSTASGRSPAEQMHSFPNGPIPNPCIFRSPVGPEAVGRLSTEAHAPACRKGRGLPPARAAPPSTPLRPRGKQTGVSKYLPAYFRCCCLPLLYDPDVCCDSCHCLVFLSF